MQMNKDDIWSNLDSETFKDKRVVKLVGKTKIDERTLELSFKKPNNFQYRRDEYAVVKLLDPKVTELDVEYRWLPFVSDMEEDTIRFKTRVDNSSFAESCDQLEIDDEAIVFGPMT